MINPSRIAVVGAGIAGLACADALIEAGFAVSLVDKSRGPSGRMSTRRGDDWQCDHGAQYFTARSPEFRAEVARWQAAGVAAVWPLRLHVIDAGGGRQADEPLERFVGVPRMTAPARFLAEHLGPRLGTTIRRLERAPGGWRLESKEQGWLDERFDAVVLAVPAPQAVPLLQQQAPALAALCSQAVMRGCWAAMLRYEGPVDLPFDGAFVNAGPLRWVARDNSKPGRSGRETWLLHAASDWSEAHLEDDADGVADALIEAFRRLGAPAPRAWTTHRWRYADTEPALDEVCFWRAEQGLGLCGDWLNGGKVEGAWSSGRALASAVTRSLAST